MQISGLAAGCHLCTDDVTVGPTAEPATGPDRQAP